MLDWITWDNLYVCITIRVELELDRESRSRPGFLVPVFLGPISIQETDMNHETMTK